MCMIYIYIYHSLPYVFFTLTQLRSYSTSDKESERDYVLNCEDKFDVEYAYDGYLLSSLIVICFGSTLLFSFLSLKLCSIKYDKTGKENVVSKYDPPQSSESYDVGEIFHSCKNGSCIEVDATFERHKTYFSVVLIVNIVAASFLITDAEGFNQNRELLQEAFWYSYGSFYMILFVTALVALLIEIPVFSLYFIVFCRIKFFPKDHCFGRTVEQHQNCLKYILIISTVLTIISFIYVLSRGFLVSLVFATYPLEVGFILLAIGSGFFALLFVVWAAVHIGVESYNAKAKLFTTIIYLVPYGAFLIILTGFLVSYIYVILRLSIRLDDPVTSLVAAMVPATIGYIAANRYKSGLAEIRRGTSNQMEPQPETRDVEGANSTEAQQLPSAIKPSAIKPLDAFDGERLQEPIENVEVNVDIDPVD